MKYLSFMAAVSFCISLQSCQEQKKEEEEKIKYLVTTPIQLDTTVTKDYVAQVLSVRNIEIRAQERGFLQKIFVDEGQNVGAGKLLFKIMPSF